MAALAEALGVPVEANEIVSHDTKHAVVNYARRRGVGAVLAEHERLRLRSRLLGRPFDWIVRHAPCDVPLVELDGYDGADRVGVAADGGIYPPVAVRVAEAVAAANDGSVVLWGSPETDGPDARRRTLGDYRAELAAALSVPVEATALRTDGGQVRPPALLVRRGADHRLRSALFDDGPAARPTDGATLTVYPHESRRPGLVRRALERTLF